MRRPSSGCSEAKLRSKKRARPFTAAIRRPSRVWRSFRGPPKRYCPRFAGSLETVRPSVFGFFATQGPFSFEDRMTNIRLLGREVLPAVREYGKELGLLDPFEREPGSRPYVTGTPRAARVGPQVARSGRELIRRPDRLSASYNELVRHPDGSGGTARRWPRAGGSRRRKPTPHWSFCASTRGLRMRPEDGARCSG